MNSKFSVIEFNCMVNRSQLGLYKGLAVPNVTRSAAVGHCDSRCSAQLAHGYMAHCLANVESTTGFACTRTTAIHRINMVLHHSANPAPEEWPDKAVSSISHHLIGPREWLMKSHATAADKTGLSQVTKDKSCGCEWGAGRFLGQNTAFR